MKMSIKRVLPICFVIISLLYILFVLSLEPGRMIGDERGWDPGTRALPLFVGLLMLGLSIYLTVKESRIKETIERIDPSALKLIIQTMMLCVCYVLFFRYIGFILSTSALLYTLIFFNCHKDINKSLLGEFFVGLTISIIFTLLVYTMGRAITRELFLIGRSAGIILFKSRIFSAGMATIATALLFMVVLIIAGSLRKTRCPRILLISVMTSAGMTELIYIVFKQIFRVSLAAGLVSW
jgi:hypothetical protein